MKTFSLYTATHHELLLEAGLSRTLLEQSGGLQLLGAGGNVGRDHIGKDKDERKKTLEYEGKETNKEGEERKEKQKTK